MRAYPDPPFLVFFWAFDVKFEGKEFYVHTPQGFPLFNIRKPPKPATLLSHIVFFYPFFSLLVAFFPSSFPPLYPSSLNVCSFVFLGVALIIRRVSLVLPFSSSQRDEPPASSFFP